MEQSKASHTPTPWRIEVGEGQLGDGSVDYSVYGANDEFLMSDTPYYPSAPDPQDAEFIVRAVNSYDEMLAVLKECLGLANIAETLTGCRSDDDYVAGIKAQIEAAIYRAEAANTKKGLRG